MEVPVVFLLLLIPVAFLYASVGHGGASGYLALMALFSFAPEVMKPTALLLNVFVSLIAFIQYYRKGYFSWSLFLPLATASIPAAFIGGYLTLSTSIYRHLLGALLLLPAVRFILPQKNLESPACPMKSGWALFYGAVIGLLSGMIGIGGGILLSPLLLFLRWSDVKQTAAVSALFIFVNSISGLAGHFQQGMHISASMAAMVVTAIAGGLAGSYFGVFRFNQVVLKRILGLVLILASLKLLLV